MRHFAQFALAAAIASFSISAFAALPQPGLWSIDAELTGKPGRGIQIDRQGGETVIASYFGYRADGTAAFYQAVGKIANGTTFAADLIEYKGGIVLGGPGKDAEEARNIGPIQITFNTETSGTVALPGEMPKAFSRVVYEDHRARLNNSFVVSNFTYAHAANPIQQLSMTFKVDGNQLSITYDDTSGSDNCVYKGDLVADGAGFNSNGSIGCAVIIATQPPRFDRFENLKVDDKGVLTGIHRTGSAKDKFDTETQLLGQCVEQLAVVTGSTQTLQACSAPRLGLKSAE